MSEHDPSTRRPTQRIRTNRPGADAARLALLDRIRELAAADPAAAAMVPPGIEMLPDEDLRELLDSLPQ